MEHPEKAPRAPARVPVLVTEGRRIEHFFTALVGPESVFIVTRSPAPAGSTVTLTFTLPDGQLFEAQGEVTQTLAGGEGRDKGIPPGMDLRLSGLSSTASQRWEAFVARAAEQAKSGGLPLGWEALAPAPVYARGAGEPRRATILYHVVPPSLDKLEELADSVPRPQGIFVRTDDVRPAGTQAIVCVVHPLSGDEFHLLGEVLEGREQGVALRFRQLGPQTLRHLRQFIELGIPDDRSHYEAAGLESAPTTASVGPLGLAEAEGEERSIELDASEIEYCTETSTSLSLDYDALQSGVDPVLELSFESSLLGEEPSRPRK